MSTVPVVPVVPQSELSVFVHKVLYAHVGVLVLLLALMGTGGYFGLRSYDKALAHAESLQVQFNAAQAQFTASQKQLTDLLAVDSAQRAQESAQQASLTQQIIQRDAKAPAPAVQTALQPSASAESVVLGLQSLYTGSIPTVVPKVTPDGNIEISAPEGQLWVSDKLSLNRFSADFQDEVKLYTLEQAKSTSLSNDLAQCTASNALAGTSLVDAKKTIAAYEKIAKRSRWKKFLSGAEKVALVVAGIEIGHKL